MSYVIVLNVIPLYRLESIEMSIFLPSKSIYNIAGVTVMLRSNEQTYLSAALITRFDLNKDMNFMILHADNRERIPLKES